MNEKKTLIAIRKVLARWNLSCAEESCLKKQLADELMLVVKNCNAPAVSVELPLTEARLSALHDIAKQYCYTTQDDSPTISRKGVELLLVEYSKGN